MSKDAAIVLFLDDNEDLRELMPVLLETTLGVRCLSFGSLMELQANAREVLRANVAILDINLGPDVPDGIDAFHWLKDQGFQGKILFLTGHARTSSQLEFAEGNGVEILEKPLSPDKIISSVARALNPNS